ncbi:MAG TPA: hypothetical protein VKT53_08280 [Candidatus Acidoferrum sp.]|nr:hypothetical protein [Candidatus Acidoferrum sp.]
MNRSTKLKVAAAVLIASAACVSLGRNSVAQEGKPPSLPTPEMQKLSKLYLGTWTYTENYPKSPMAPNGGVNTGVYTSELGPGGNSIFNHFHSKGPVGEFDGTIVMTWDPKEKLYKAYIFGDSFPTAIVETGQWENDALVYRFELAMGSTKFALRSVTKFLPDGKLTSDEFSSVNGAPESLLVHVEAGKK